ncbi:MAG: chorismate mutase [Thermoclostridium sp.]|nr:chorismate mutase [Thermoclostridium sp.]
MELNLNEIRIKINAIDEKLVKLFEERMETVSEVAAYKKQHNMEVLDSNREKDVIARAVSHLHNPELETYLRFFMDDLMTLSRQYQLAQLTKDHKHVSTQAERTLQPGTVIGHYGSSGSYSEEAAVLHFGSDIVKKSCNTFEEVVYDLLNHKIDIGMLPVENSSTGIITAVMDLIRDNQVYITGEHISRICHHLLVVPGTKLEDINTVYSHQQGLEQSSHFLKKYPWEQVAYNSTANSAELVSRLGDKTKAAVASESSARLYGLEILVPDIHYNQNNYTRFISIEREPVVHESCNKISIVMDIAHKPGALYTILRLFNERSLNLMKIESRPVIGKPWEYLFFFDFEGNLMEPRIRELLECLKATAHDFRVLGNYRAFEPSGC